jgi:hypothetical protein
MLVGKELQKIMRTALLVLAVLISVRLAAQPVDAQSQQHYSDPDTALYTAVTTVGTYQISAVVPVTTSTIFGIFVSWNVVRQADAAECSEPSADQPPPVVWTGTPTCGSGLGGPVVTTFSTLAELRTWELANLDATQRKTAIRVQAVGNQFSFRKWWLVYQVHSSFCS